MSCYVFSYITYVMLLYNMRHVLLYITFVMSCCYITYVTLCYITCVMSCYVL